MGHELASPFADVQQQMSAQIYSGKKAGELHEWRCSKRIPKDLALSIYQGNLHGGVAQHLQTHFPVAYAYLGEHAYQVICAEYLKASPPEQPIFTIYAAHFPGFMLEYGEQNPQQLIWSVAAQLAQIDFFHHNAFCEGQRIDVEEQYYTLWLDTRSAINDNSYDNAQGLYQRLDLHPEHYQQASRQVALLTFWEGDELFFRLV